MSPDAEPSWGSFFEEFHCRECGGDEAYRSRARNFFERYLLPLFLLQPVRCERCFHRCYILRTIAVLERKQIERKIPESQRQGNSKPSTRIA